MKKLFIVIIMYSLSANAQKTSRNTTPSSIIDSIFISIKKNDYKKFNRQFMSIENSFTKEKVERGKHFKFNSDTNNYPDSIKISYEAYRNNTNYIL